MKKALIAAVVLIVVASAYYFFFRPAGPERGLKNISGIQNKKIVAFGDDLTVGQGASSPDFSYPSQLAVLLGRDVVNFGRIGDTSVLALNRIDQVLAVNPGLVLITLGSNDLRENLDLGQTVNSLEAIFKQLQAGGAAVVYLSIAPPLVGDNWAMAIKDVVRANGVLWVDDVMTGLWGDPEFMSDEVHPNDKGYEKITGRVFEVVSTL